LRNPLGDQDIVRNERHELGVEPHDDFLLETGEGRDKCSSDLGREIFRIESGAAEAEENNSVIRRGYKILIFLLMRKNIEISLSQTNSEKTNQAKLK
jgi:hypothetical protein